MNFQLDRVTVQYVNKVAQAIANDLNYGTKTVRKTLDAIAKDFGFEFAIWVMEKAQANVLGE
jgi:hypothetical protein